MSWRRPWHSDEAEVIGYREFGSLLPLNVKRQIEYAAGLASYPVRRLLHRSGGKTMNLPAPPNSPWISAAREVARAELDDLWMRHSERTWLFASALAEAVGDHVDEKLLYVASLLHDTGIRDGARTRCFAVTGAQFAYITAETAGIGEDRAKIVADAISSHISLDPGNELGKYVQAGSLLDLTGEQVWRLDRALVLAVCAQWTRAGFPDELRYRWTQECVKFPNGRAAFARRPGGLLAAGRLAPLPD